MKTRRDPGDLSRLHATLLPAGLEHPRFSDNVLAIRSVPQRGSRDIPTVFGRSYLEDCALSLSSFAQLSMLRDGCVPRPKAVLGGCGVVQEAPSTKKKDRSSPKRESGIGGAKKAEGAKTASAEQHEQCVEKRVPEPDNKDGLSVQKFFSKGRKRTARGRKRDSKERKRTARASRQKMLRRHEKSPGRFPRQDYFPRQRRRPHDEARERGRIFVGFVRKKMSKSRPSVVKKNLQKEYPLQKAMQMEL